MQVFVIDDEMVSRMALVDLVESLGFKDIVEFSDGLSAWQYLNTEKPKPILICCDIRMPKMSGTDLLIQIRKDERLSNIPFVLVTSKADRDTVGVAIKQGINGYIVKPFDAGNAGIKLKDVLNKEWGRIIESPQTTAKRLNIPVNKLIAYYSAFAEQVEIHIERLEDQQVITNANSQTNQLSESPELQAIHTGCLTLGFWHCSQQIENLNCPNKNPPDIISYLKILISTVEYQKSACAE